MNYILKSELGLDKQSKFDHINQIITLSMMTLCGLYRISSEFITSVCF